MQLERKLESSEMRKSREESRVVERMKERLGKLKEGLEDERWAGQEALREVRRYGDREMLRWSWWRTWREAMEGLEGNRLE